MGFWSWHRSRDEPHGAKCQMRPVPRCSKRMAPVISHFPWTSKASARSANVEYGELQRFLDAAVETEEVISEGFVLGIDWRGSHPCLQGWCCFWASFLVLFLCLGSVRLWPFPFGSRFFPAPFFSLRPFLPTPFFPYSPFYLLAILPNRHFT